MKTTTVLTTIAIFSLVFASGCRNEAGPPKEKIESITFDKERVTLKIEEEVTVRVTAKPDAARKNEKISYTSTNDGVIEIREPTNDGFIVKGLKGGSTVIMAKSENVNSYLEVVVENNVVVRQYINVPNPVVEVNEGDKITAQVSLYGGNILDNNNFRWRIESEKENISLEATQNIAVIKGEKRGVQRVIISHEKAEFDNEILVFVKGVDENIKYITSKSNIFVVPLDNQFHDASLELVNGAEIDKNNFQFEITSNSENIEMIPNRNILNIRGEKPGVSTVKVSHPLAEIDFEMRVLTVEVAIPYITVEQTFAILNIGDFINITAIVENPRYPASVLDEFSYTVNESQENVVDVMQTNNMFYIRGNKDGNAEIIISNMQTELSKKILIIVREDIKLDYYITTSQNVVLTQVGDKETQLNIQLVNGNEADANNFEWVVDDSGIITVESGHGKVKNTRSVIRSVFNGIAVITPKKAGTAKITISHPKSETTMTVIVKVYPRGTFALNTPNLGGEGLFKVVKGTPLPVSMEITSGSMANIGSLNWAIRDTPIAEVDENLHGLSNVINGLSTGITKLLISGDALEYPFEALVMSGTQEELDMMSVIYVDNVYQKMVTEQVVHIPVKDSNNLYTNTNNYTVKAEDENIVYAVMIKSQLVLQGKNAGETKLRIDHRDAMNFITINIRVDPAHISIDKPYYLSGPEIVGVVKNTDKEVTVKLVGASDAETGDIEWKGYDTGVLDVISNGELAILTGKAKYNADGEFIPTQTKITISHKKSENDKIILVYVVENEADLNNKVAIGLKSENYLLTMGEDTLVTLITNASESQKLGLQWNIKYGADKISIDPHYDSAMIRAIGVGNAEITVTHRDNIIPATIYVSVIEAYSAEKTIKGPAVIEILTGESKIVSASHLNLTQDEVKSITWSLEGKNIANIESNGDNAYLLGLTKGIDYVNIDQNNLNYHHRATLVCANTLEELSQMYVFGVQDSYHVMTEGEEKRIKLEFGSAGFPETAKSEIEWTADAGGHVRVIGNGDSATVIAEKEGYGTVYVQSEVSYNKKIAINFTVYKQSVQKYEFRGYDKIVGLVVGNSKQLAMEMWWNNEQITTGYSGIELKENTVPSVADVNIAGNLVDIIAREAGQTFITIEHKDVTEDARILVYTANTQEELDSYYPISVDKTHYLIQVGESVNIKLNTIADKDAANENDIQWGIENASIIESPQFLGKREAIIKGKFTGQCIVNINFKGKTVERVHIAVAENSVIDSSKNIVTESIIGMVKGEIRETTIQTNLSDNEAATLVWKSSNEDLITVTGSGRRATITAKGTIPANNEAYVTVSYGSWLTRNILVFVCDTQAQVNSYKAMNIDNQYYRVGKNETLIIPMYYAPNKPAENTEWIDRYGNKVVDFIELEGGDKIEITSLNEGVAVLEASNAGRSNNGKPVQIYVEVSNRYTNLPKVPELRYLTTAKTLYVLNPDEPDIYADIMVSGIGMTPQELQNIKWKIDSGDQYVKIYPNGQQCRVLSNKKEGEATLRVSHTDNTLEIKIIVTKNPDFRDIAYIDMEDVIKMGKGDTREIMVNLRNGGDYSKNAFKVSVETGKNIADASMTGNMLSVTAKELGQALLRISCEGYAQFDKEVIVIVTPDGFLYLTTRDNFSVVKREEYKTLQVDMMGYDPKGQGFSWKVDEEHKNLVTINASGNQVQVMGKNIGIARIIASHNLLSEDFNLSLYVRVTEMDITPVYITTPKNIISTIEGSSFYIQAELVNGKPEESSLFTWINSDSNVITTEGYGNQIIVLAKAPGISRIRINHSSSMNTVDVVVIVEKDRSHEGIYITTDSNLIEARPNETKRISVRLVGGNPEDIYGFRWDIVDYNSIEKVAGTSVSKEVIKLVASADSAYITGMNEGEATIEVSHPKTNYRLTFKINVLLFTKINFTQKNITMNMGETKTVAIEAPSGSKVVYTAVGANGKKVVDVYGTNKVCIIDGIDAGVAIIGATNPQGTTSDELIVEVKKVNDVKIRYIEVPQSLFNMTDINVGTNRLKLAAKTVGTKDNNAAFIDIDSYNIVWTIAAGKEFITLNEINFTNSNNASITANEVSIGPLKPGNATIKLTHPDMPGYERTIYVNVEPHDYNFIVFPTYHFIELMEGTTNKISWAINNMESPDYTNVTATYKGSPLGDSKELILTRTGAQEAQVTGIKAGQYIVEIEYGGKIINVVVNVTRPFRFEINENYVVVAPGSIRQVNIELEPADAEVISKVDWMEFIEFTNSERPTDPFVRNSAGHIIAFRFKGTQEEGFTQVKLTSNGIERVFTIRTTRSLAFGPINEYEIRGEPGATKTFSFSIEPNYDNVYFEQDSNLSIDGGDRLITEVPKIDNMLLNSSGAIIASTGGTIDEGNRKFNVTLKNAGVARLKFTGETGSQYGYSMEVPVLVYYPYIPVNIDVTRSRNDNGFDLFESEKNIELHSTTGRNPTAITIAEGETVKLTLNTDSQYKMSGIELSHHGNQSERISPNDNNEFSNENLEAIMLPHASNVNNKSYLLAGTINSNSIEIQGLNIGTTSPSSYGGKDILRDVQFAGVLKVYYQYYNGNNLNGKKASFYESFLLYYERWYRK